MNFFFTLLFSSFFLLSCQTKNTSEHITKINGITHTGESVAIQTKNSKATVVIFLSSLCPCSDSNMEMLKAEAKKYPEYQFVGIHSNFNEDPQEAKLYFEKENLGFPIIKDYDSRLVNIFNAVKTPHVFILDQDGKFLYKGGTSNSSNLSSASENYLEKSLIAIKEHKSLPVPKRKTLGCYIPRKKGNS